MEIKRLNGVRKTDYQLFLRYINYYVNKKKMKKNIINGIILK